MRTLGILTMFVVLITAVGFTGGEDEKTELSPFVENAVLQGLTAEQFPRGVAKEMLDNSDYWVGKCPICGPVQDGFTAYLASAPDESAESEAPRGVMEEFGDDDGNDADKRSMLQEMIDRYVTAHYTRLEMTVEESSAMQELLVGGRKRGMSLVQGTPGYTCPSCEGAADAIPAEATEAEEVLPTPE
jgi:hypothetical protein